MPYFFYQGKRCFSTCSGVGPPLLFLHGNTASSQMFQFLLPFYTPCFHCILRDFLGSGRSQRMPELPPQLWIDQGRQAAALIRHLGLGPVFLVGTSGGAWAALNAGLTRRAVRDYSFRGTGVADTLEMWANVRRGEKLYISPYKNRADIIFDSSLPDEVSVMKNFALPLLQAVPEENARRGELLELIEAFQWFEPIDPELVPVDSLLREFIGGGSYKYH